MAEGDGPENRYARKGIGGSNPPASANFQIATFGRLLPRPAKRGEAIRLRRTQNPNFKNWRCLLVKIRTFFDENPDCEF